MNKSRAVFVTKRNLRQDFNKVYELYSNKLEKESNFLAYSANCRDIGCQFDCKKNNIIRTGGNVPIYRKRDMTYFNDLAKQIYLYHRSGSHTDVGVGCVKVLQKKRVKRVYLPDADDRGVGSEDLSPYCSRRSYQRSNGCYYDRKRTSSKCVGGMVELNTVSLVSEKLSPIIQTRTGATSLSDTLLPTKNVEIGSNTDGKNLVAITTQVEEELLNSNKNRVSRAIKHQPVFEIPKEKVKLCNENKVVEAVQRLNNIPGKQKTIEKVISSNSLVEHVYDLEIPSVDKHSHLSLDPIENKLEREYRKMFSSKVKDKKPNVETPTQDLKTASVLRKRFEALRKGFVKKDDSKKNAIINKKLSIETSEPSHKDVSIVSDPPSLEGRSYSNTKRYNPFHCNVEMEKDIFKQNMLEDKSYNEKKDRVNSQWSSFDYKDIENQGVKGMFRLWGKKFNLEEDYYKKKPNSVSSFQLFKLNKKSEQTKKLTETELQSKKEGRKFLFFKKKNKEKPNTQFKPKKSVTAGRCELRDGLMIKIPGNSPSLDAVKKKVNISNEILRKSWLKKYLSPNIDSKHSIQIRWNNKTYPTSSSTVFDLIDSVFKETGMVYQSRSDVTTEESLYYKPHTQHVNFATQEIEAYMIAKTLRDKIKHLPIKIKNISKDDIEVQISDQKWIIDKSRAFSDKIELVLHANNDIKSSKDSSSSEYLRIDIPKGFFFDSSSSEEYNKTQSSEEEVYKIVEYETEFDSRMNKKGQTDFEAGDHKETAIEILVDGKRSKGYGSNVRETVIKQPPEHRDVLIQGSNVHVPKRCDIVGVGIITQRDLREINKPILKIPEHLSDEESDFNINQTTQTCTFAESYLQDYYRNWTPFDIDFLSWCLSDSNLKCCSEKSASSFYATGNETKSCPNMYDDFQASTAISAIDPCIPCAATPEVEEEKDTFAYKLFKKLKSRARIWPHECCKRILPKDSLEVFKRRQMYATSNKSKWDCPSYGDVKPYSVPSNEDKEAQNTMSECPKLYHQPTEAKQKKKFSKKHVSMLDCEAVRSMVVPPTAGALEGILSHKSASECDTCKKLGEENCKQHVVIKNHSACMIPDVTCKVECVKDIKALSSKPSAKSGNSSTYVIQSEIRPAPYNTLPTCKKSLTTKTSHDCKTTLPCKPLLSNRCLCKTPSEKSPLFVPTIESKYSASKPVPFCECKPSPNYKRLPAFQPVPLSKPSLCCTPTTPHNSPKNCRRPPYYAPSPPICQPKPSPVTKKCSSNCAHCKTKSSRPSTPPCFIQPYPTYKPVPICPHFPPCRKSQSSQISPKNSPQAIQSSKQHYPKETPYKYSPPKTPENNKSPVTKGSRCNTCVANRKEKNSPPHPSKCVLQPCRKPSPPNNIDKNCLWPLKNQVSNQPSIDSIVQPPENQPQPAKNLNQCKKSCPLLPENSNKSLLSKEKKTKNNKCNPTPPVISPSASRCRPSPPDSANSKSKISGLFLKLKPSKKKTCSKDCLAIQDKKDDNFIRLNSKEKIKIRLKEQNPSTEEIREGMNFKVKDIDGKTLYERKEYRKEHPRSTNALLGELYKSSNVNTVSTPMGIKQESISNINSKKGTIESRSDASLANLIEIQFKLKVKQDNKTDINIANDDNDENKIKINEKNISQQQDLFIVKNKENYYNEKIAPKDDVNIKITIKNYKPNIKSKEKDKNNQDFVKNISEKFHTVSTGYSNVFSEIDADNVYSIHRATIDLTSSTEKSKTQNRPSDESTGIELVKPEPLNFSACSNSTKPSQSRKKIEIENIKDKSISSIRNSPITSIEFNTDTQDEDFKLSDLNSNAGNIASSEIIEHPLSTKVKKELMRKVFEKANTMKSKNKNRMKQLRDLLKIILTSDSSGAEDIAVTGNDLAKDVTYASLEPNYYRETDSTNNYYAIDSAVSVDRNNGSNDYQTEEVNSECSVTSVYTPEIKAQGCMCSVLAERLKLCNTGERSCCCRGKVKTNKETSCNLKSEEDFEALSSKSTEIDVATQNSNYKENKIHSTSLNIKNQIGSNIIKRTSTVLAQYEELMNLNEAFKDSNSARSRTESKVHNLTTLGINASLRGEERVIINANSIRLSKHEREAEKSPDERKRMHYKTKRNEKVLSDFVHEADVLQSYETKKAVLEIYTEKSISENGGRLVAKLPKFVFDSEREIRNSDLVMRNYRRVCKKNIVMMSVQR